jgi:hypothetical protein
VALLSLLALATITPVAYRFPLDRPLQYDVQVVFEGYIPLLGGQEGKVEVNLGVKVQGLAPDSDAKPRAASELNAFKILFNGADLTAIGLDSAKAYFPKTTVSLTPEGRVLKTDAPDVEIPVRLPGLDVKRFLYQKRRILGLRFMMGISSLCKYGSAANLSTRIC